MDVHGDEGWCSKGEAKYVCPGVYIRRGFHLLNSIVDHIDSFPLDWKDVPLCVNCCDPAARAFD